MSRVKDFWYDWGDLLVFSGGCAVVIFLIVTIGVIGNYAWSSHTCESRADQMDLQHDYGFWTECMVRFNSNDPWVPLDDVRVQAGELYTEKEEDGDS